MKKEFIEEFCRSFLQGRDSAVVMPEDLISLGITFADFSAGRSTYMQIPESERAFALSSEYHVQDEETEYNIKIEKRA
jgi:hypothetical protein